MLRLTQLFNITGHPAIALPGAAGRRRAAAQRAARRRAAVDTERLLAIAAHASSGASRAPR